MTTARMIILPRLRAFLTLICLTVVALAAQGCSERDLHVQNDDWANPELALQVSVPTSATDVAKGLGSGTSDYAYKVEFLMPNDDWRRYLADYYPDGAKKSKLPYSNGTVPPACTRAFRDGIPLTAWTASDDIPYFGTSENARRRVTVTEDCKPGLSFIHWTLYSPTRTTNSP